MAPDPDKTVLAGMFLHLFVDYLLEIFCFLAWYVCSEHIFPKLQYANIFELCKRFCIANNSTVNAYSPGTSVDMPAFADILTLFRTVHNLMDMNVMDGTDPW
jgi:hypothetical protein